MIKKIKKKPKYLKFFLLYSILLLSTLLTGCLDETQTTEYNLTVVGNQTSILSFVQSVNTNLMFGWYGDLILMATFFILFIAFVQKTGRANASFASASFIVFGLSLFLIGVNLIHTLTIFVTLIMAAGSVVMLKNQ